MYIHYNKYPYNLHSAIFRFIVRGFYGVEHGLILDVLIRNACVKEEDIQVYSAMFKLQLYLIYINYRN